MKDFYVKAYLVGEEDIPIIAEIKKHCKHRYHDEWAGPYASYSKGKDLVTGTPLIFDCNDGNFVNELSKYGLARKIYVGARKVTKLSKEEVHELLNMMDEEYIERYTEVVQKAKLYHAGLLKKHYEELAESKRKSITDEMDFRLQKNFVKKLSKIIVKCK